MFTRRNFIKKVSILTALSAFPFFSASAEEKNTNENENISKILAKKLQKGDLIGLIAPGGNISEKLLKESEESLSELGFRTYHTENILAEEGYLAGTDQQRADDIMHMFSKKEVDAIICVRGGYGTVRTLDLLDYEVIKQNPKVLMGYSDMTALIAALYTKIGLVSFHGPVGSSTFNKFTTKIFKKVVMKGKEKYKFPYEKEKGKEENTEFDVYTINSGVAEGELVGGNLMMLITLIGTEYEPNFENKIVFIEEIGEKSYKVDRMITQLVMATNFSKAKGVVCGIFKNCEKDEDEKHSFTLKEVMTKRLKPLNIPIYYGAPFGHVANKFTLPVGINAKLNADKHTLTLLEAAVV